MGMMNVTAGQQLGAGMHPVRLVTGNAAPLLDSDAGLQGFIGFVRGPVSASAHTRMILPEGLVRGFSGLTVGAPYVVTADGLEALSALTPGKRYLPAGVAVSTSTLLWAPHLVLSGAGSGSVSRTASGALSTARGVAQAGVTKGQALCLHASGTLVQYDGSAGQAERFVGLAVHDADAASVVALWTPGTLAEGLSGLTAGTTYAAINGGAVVARASVQGGDRGFVCLLSQSPTAGLVTLLPSFVA